MRSLGYTVDGHVGEVQVTLEVDPDSSGNHVALTVSALPSVENPSGIGYVDVGLGDALHEALRG